MNRHRLGRFATLLTTAAAASMLVGALVLPMAAIAADTRILWIGAPDLAVDVLPQPVPDGTPDTSGVILPTRVTVPASGAGPYATMFEVEILNGGGQNLANTVLTINADVHGLAGLSLLTSYDPDGGSDASSAFCTTSGDVITCDYGSLPAGQERTVAVVVEVTSSFTATSTTGLFDATVTTNNENGSNTQTVGASSLGFTVEPTGADTLSTFVLDGVIGQNLATSGVGAGNMLNTSVTFNTSNKELVQINEGNSDTDALYPCPAGLTCQPEYSEVTTTSGSFATSPFFTWKLAAIVPKTYALSQGFVAHFPTGGSTPDWTLSFKSKSALCGTNIDAKVATAGQCIKTLSLTKFDRTSNLLVVEVVMNHQGGMKY